MALAIGGWIRFMTGFDEAGAKIDGIKDPQGGAKLMEMAASVVADPTARTLRPFLTEYFGEDVGLNEVAIRSIAAAVAAINAEGTTAVLRKRYCD